MQALLHPLILFLLISITSLTSSQTVRGQESATAVTTSDPEYDRYKKRGDVFFKEGKYPEARRQYQNCLEVPGFETDEYAQSQIDECTRRLAMRQKVDDAFRLNKTTEAVDLLKQLLALNPDDPITKAQLADYYERASKHSVNPNRHLETLPRTQPSQTVHSVRKPNRQFGLKIAAGVVAVGAGVYAYSLRHDYQTKMDALNLISQTVDPNGIGVIDKPDAYQQYDDAYQAAQAAQQKNGTFKACLGVAALATLAEAYLFVHKPRLRSNALHWQPSSQSIGLALGFTF